jgi:hypothetical protein
MMQTATERPVPIHPDELPEIQALKSELDRCERAEVEASNRCSAAARLATPNPEDGREVNRVERLQAELRLPELRRAYTESELAVLRARERWATARDPKLAEFRAAMRAEAQVVFDRFVAALQHAFAAHQDLRAMRAELQRHGLTAPPVFPALCPETPTVQSALSPWLRTCCEAGFPADWVPPRERDEQAWSWGA